MIGYATCPLCGHQCNVDVAGFRPFVTCCDDPQEGGCGEYFVAELMELLIESYNIEGRRDE